LPLPDDYDFDAAIVHPNSVCLIALSILTSSQLNRLASAMQEQFSALVYLYLRPHPNGRPALALPDEFLGGSAPRLQYLRLESISFPALPKVLLSATDLVELTLLNIPHSGYISPGAIITGLAVLANLKILNIGFRSPLSRPNRESRHLPPPARTVLPSLTRFQFYGASEYLEDLVGRIDSPLLDFIGITFFHQFISDIPQLALFMRRAPILGAFHTAHMDFNSHRVCVRSSPMTQTAHETSYLKILCRKLDRQLSSLAQVLTLFFLSIDMVELLAISGSRDLPSQGQDDIESMRWRENFQQLTAVKNLFVSKEFTQTIALALQELVGESVTGVLPALESLFLEGLQSSELVQEAIGKFVSARELSGHPVAVIYWNST
jgi:hypothetical protein